MLPHCADEGRLWVCPHPHVCMCETRTLACIACMPVYHACAWCPRGAEDGIESGRPRQPCSASVGNVALQGLCTCFAHGQTNSSSVPPNARSKRTSLTCSGCSLFLTLGPQASPAASLRVFLCPTTFPLVLTALPIPRSFPMLRQLPCPG